MVTEEERLGKDVFINYPDDDDLKISSTSDLTAVTGRMNLTQAIVNRLRTAPGELTLHPDYGCRLVLLIGTVPNEFTLNLAKQHIREALLQEPRVKTIDSIKTSFSDSSKKVMECEIEVTPIDSEQPLNIIYPFFMTGET